MIAHLIEEGLKAGRSFIAACMDAFKRLQGCYALLVISPDARRLVAFRKDLPLVVGVAEGGIIFASDASVLLQWTPKMIYLPEQRCGRSLQKELVLRLIDGEENKRKKYSLYNAILFIMVPASIEDNAV